MNGLHVQHAYWIAQQTWYYRGWGGANVFVPAQAALPNGAGDVSEGKMARLEKEVKDFTSKLETASAQVRVTFLACLSHYSIG